MHQTQCIKINVQINLFKYSVLTTHKKQNIIINKMQAIMKCSLAIYYRIPLSPDALHQISSLGL